jgi:hypothetical protein
MEESERSMKSRFAKPHYRFVALDDMDMELVRTCRRSQKIKSKNCVVIGIQDVSRLDVTDSDLQTNACVVTAEIVWGKDGERLSAAVIKAMTLVEPNDDTDELALEFAADLVEFLDKYDSDIGTTMSRFFVSSTPG